MGQLSDILKKNREERGWNKSQMARAIGISSQLYGQYEKGEKTPGGEFFVQWKKIFGTDLTSNIETFVSHETLRGADTGHNKTEVIMTTIPAEVLTDLTRANSNLAAANQLLAEAQLIIAQALNLGASGEVSKPSPAEKRIVNPDPVEYLSDKAKKSSSPPFVKKKGKLIGKDK